MRHLLLPCLLLFTSAALAQQPLGTGGVFSLPASLPASCCPQEIGSWLLKYRSGYVVGQPSYLYRTLSDARRGRYAYRVRPGDRLFAVNDSATTRWRRVARHSYYTIGPVPAGCDRTIYYLPASALPNKAGELEAFGL